MFQHALNFKLNEATNRLVSDEYTMLGAWFVYRQSILLIIDNVVIYIVAKVLRRTFIL